MAKTSASLGKVKVWGIYDVAKNELVDVSLGRLAIRASKRNVFQGNGFKVVQLDAKLFPYAK